MRDSNATKLKIFAAIVSSLGAAKCTMSLDLQGRHSEVYSPVACSSSDSRLQKHESIIDVSPLVDCQVVPDAKPLGARRG